MASKTSPDIMRARIRLAGVLSAILQSQGLTQRQASERLDIDQPDVSRLACEKLERFSLERLMRFLTELDHDVEIRIRPKSRQRSRGNVRVVSKWKSSPTG